MNLKLKIICCIVIVAFVLHLLFGTLYEKVTENTIEELNSFDKLCDSTGEWEMIGRDIFIKRSGVFYFYDAKFLRIHLIKNSRRKFWFKLEIFILDQNDVVLFKNRSRAHKTVVNMQWHVKEYDYSVITSHVDLPFINVYCENIKMAIRITESASKKKTRSLLNVKVKRLRENSSTKKGNVLCSKSYHFKTNDYLTLRWWIELNKQMGHEKIFMWDHDIVKNPEFDALFLAYKDTVILNKLMCLPNLQYDQDQFKNYRYLKHHSQMVYGPSNYAVHKYELINQLLMNECYMDNIEKYRYVTICDIDEVIIPKKTQVFSLNQVQKFITSGSEVESLKCNRYQFQNSLNNQSILENYLDELAFLQHKKPVVYYFKESFYVDGRTIEKIFDALKDILSNDKTDQAPYNYAVSVLMDDVVNVSFTIQSKTEFDYAKQLEKVYREVVFPYLDKHKQKIENNALDYDRLFFISGLPNDTAHGKSIHDTSYTLDLSHHYIDHRIVGNYTVDYNLDYPERYQIITYDYGHFSHFRHKPKYRYLPQLSIKTLHLDLNYFICYFKPILNAFDQKLN